jgi:hypothetical protein
MRCHDDAGTESQVESQVMTQVDTALKPLKFRKQSIVSLSKRVPEAEDHLEVA